MTVVLNPTEYRWLTALGMVASAASFANYFELQALVFVLNTPWGWLPATAFVAWRAKRALKDVPLVAPTASALFVASMVALAMLIVRFGLQWVPSLWLLRDILRVLPSLMAAGIACASFAVLAKHSTLLVGRQLSPFALTGLLVCGFQLLLVLIISLEWWFLDPPMPTVLASGSPRYSEALNLVVEAQWQQPDFNPWTDFDANPGGVIMPPNTTVTLSDGMRVTFVHELRRFTYPEAATSPHYLSPSEEFDAALGLARFLLLQIAVIGVAWVIGGWLIFRSIR